VKIRTGSFTATSIIDKVSRGLMIADLIAVVASFDLVAAGDRSMKQLVLQLTGEGGLLAGVRTRSPRRWRCSSSGVWSSCSSCPWRG